MKLIKTRICIVNSMPVKEMSKVMKERWKKDYPFVIYCSCKNIKCIYKSLQ